MAQEETAVGKCLARVQFNLRAQADEDAEKICNLVQGTPLVVLENGEELLHFWYSGILWQGGVPRWCVTVLKESSASGQQAAAQVFREVAQGLLALGEEAAGS